MKKLFIFILGLLLFSFSYGDNEYTAYIKKVNSIGNFIGDTTQAINYDFDIYIEPRNNENARKNPHFIPKSSTENNEIIMKVDSIQVIKGKNVNGNFYFPVDKDNKLDILKLRVTGKIILKTSFENLKGSGRIKLGEVKENNENQRKEVWLTFDYSILKKKDTINIRVVKNMDLGVAIAGQTLKTSSPAIVEISGIKNEKITVELDESTTIKKGDDKLEVNLFFKDKKFEKKGNKKIKTIESISNSEEIEIEGTSQTYDSTPSGIYKGSFKVRVIY